MFHLKYPRDRGFFSWEELGCLARALGYPVDLFKSNVTSELTVEENGLSIEEAYKMVDHRFLERALHRTCNLHSGEWNMNVVRKCLYLLNYDAITFEELSNVRIAYQAFEAFDMKGMLPDEQTVLRSLKMCGRSIAPMKLMHRLKHMTADFEDKNRIQLAEYLDLILWCGHYKEYKPEDLSSDQGKEKDLYKILDFEKLLSHHDDRLATKLNKEYLKEEWDFSGENLGSKKMFKEPPIICAQERVEMARRQKRLYRHLKREVIKSHKMVYRVKAGFVRDRPLTAPDLSMYRQQDSTGEKPMLSAHTAYELIQKRINSAKSTSSSSSMGENTEKPRYVKTPEVSVPRVINQSDLEETKKKFEELTFDIATLERRYELSKEQQLNFYIPGYSERSLDSADDDEDSQIICLEDNDTNTLTLTPQSSPRRTPSEDAINNLAYPKSKNIHSHSNMCDARFRGWHGVKSKKGSHYVLTSPTHENSHKGRLYEKLHVKSRAQVKNVRGDFVYRYTKKEEVEKQKYEMKCRPNTAPASMQSVNEESEMEGYTEHLSPTDSSKTVDTGYGSNEDKLYDKSLPSSRGSLGRSNAWNSENDSLYESKSPSEFSTGYERKGSPLDENNDVEIKYSESSSDAMSEESLGSKIVDKSQKIVYKKTGKSDVSMEKKIVKQKETISVDNAPVPHMQHTKPKVVAVGGIGKISLLESISESQYWEDLGDKKQDGTSERDNEEGYDDNVTDGRQNEICHSPGSVDSGLVDDDINLNLSLLKHRLSADSPTNPRKEEEKKKSKGNPVKEKLLKEKEERLKKQKRLQGPSIDRIGILNPGRRESRGNSISSNDGSRKGSVTSKGSDVRRLSEQSVSSDKEKTQGDINCRKNSTMSINNSKRNSVSSPSSEKCVQKNQDNIKRNSRSSTPNKMVKKNSISHNSATKKYERLVRRVEGSISQTLTKRLLSSHA